MIRRLAGPTLATLVMLTILIGLGIWQVHRLAWKTALLAALDQAQAAAPIPLPPHPTQFQKVAVTGTLQPSQAVLYSADVRDTPQGPLLGAQLIEPLNRLDGPPVLIDLGWVPDHPATPVATPAGSITLQGYIRTPDRPHLFSAKDSPAERRFYTLNPAVIAAAIGLSQVAPYTLVVQGTAPDGTYPIPATDFPRPPNDHLSYALTWFGLAIVLLVVFLTWAHRLLREKDLPHGRL